MQSRIQTRAVDVVAEVVASLPKQRWESDLAPGSLYEAIACLPLAAVLELAARVARS